ncbi:DUF2339 domain-containing protein [bacterium]|nr:DUF2339 domain-containing protein [bacterium]
MNTDHAEHEDRMLETIEQLDARLKRIERAVETLPEEQAAAFKSIIDDEAAPSPEPRDDTEGLEYRIGRIWLPRIGVVILTLGLVFFLTLPLDVLPALVGNSMGFVFAVVIMAMSLIWRKQLPQFSRALIGGGMLLLFFAALRMHYFSPDPLIVSTTAEFIFLLLITGINLLLSLRQNSVYLATMALAMGYVTALTSTDSWILLAGIATMSVITVSLATWRQWQSMLTSGLIFAVLSHFLWSINNPLFGGEATLLTEPYANIFFLFFYVALFGFANVSMAQRSGDKNMEVVTAFFNTTMPLLVLMFLSFGPFRAQFATSQLFMSIVYLALAVGTWRGTQQRFSVFFYTMAGNLVLTAAIFEQFETPNEFLWLCLQSFLVISMAIWFRSRIIVVTNFVIFLGVFIAYLVLAPSINGISLAFGFVAIASARIMNWQRDRLELKADMLRNAYLLTALFIFPYAFHHLLPAGYVSLSWVAVGAFYYLMSKLLKNFKYRWMALTTLLAAVVHLMVVGTTSFEPTYRIVSFIVLGLVLLAVSLWYFKTSTRESTSDDDHIAPSDPPPAIH